VSLVTTLTLILTLNDPHDALPNPYGPSEAFEKNLCAVGIRTWKTCTTA